MMDKIRIHEMLECLTEVAHAELKSKGAQNIDTKEMSDVVDMVKDLAEAEKCAWEKCYYKSIVEAMEDQDKYEKSILKDMIEKYGEADGRLGYDRWRYSSGRFAPTGRGHEVLRQGYTDPKWPTTYDDPNMWPYGPIMGAVGYTEDRWNNQGSANTGSNGGNNVSSNGAGRMGYTDGRNPNYMSDSKLDQYREARRHFHETGSQDDKRVMDEQAKGYLMESLETMKDIFRSADPQLQQKMRDDLFRMYREFGGK